MFFEIFYLLFHTKCVREDLVTILSIKNLCKESIAAYKSTKSSIFVNALMLRKCVVESMENGTEMDKNFFTFVITILSDRLICYEDYRERIWPPLFTNTAHCVKDPFYPNKAKTLPGHVLKLRKKLQENRYLDSIINFPFKPTKKIEYYS